MPDGDGLKWFDFSTLTATSILGWYAWHTTTHAIPELVRAFREELAAERNQRHEHHMLVVEALRNLAQRLPNTPLHG